MNPPIKYSRQREAIINFLSTWTDHPTAETVYFYVKETIPNISLGTVYRNLSWLCENNKIKYFIVDGIVRYDRKDEHDHFICRECNNIIDIHSRPNNDKYVDSNLVIDYEIKYNGICRECLERKNWLWN